MKILLVSDTYDPLVGGVQRVVKDLAGGLAARGHGVVVATRHLAGAPEREVVDGIPVRRIRLGLPSIRPRALLGYFLRRPQADRAFGELLAESRAQVVNVHFLLSPLTHLALARIGDRQLPLVLTAHGRDVGEMFHRDYGGRRLVRTALSRAAAVTAPSMATLDAAVGLEPAAGRRLETAIPNMLPTDFATLLEIETSAPDGPLLAVGELHPKKGFDLLLHALAALPGLRLRIAGDGPQRADLKTLAGELRVADRVEFLGAVARADLAGIYRGSIALAVPSRTEPFGLVILEAFAAGLPVVAARVDGIPEVVGDSEGARLVPAEDVPALAEALAAVAGDEGLRAKMGSAGRDRARMFTIDRMVESYLEVYLAVSDGGETEG